MFFVAFFTLFWALLSHFTLFYAFLLQNQKYAHFSGLNYRKNYRKPINRHFSNYRQKYRYRFKTSSNYRWFEEIIGKVIDIRNDTTMTNSDVILNKRDIFIWFLQKKHEGTAEQNLNLVVVLSKQKPPDLFWTKETKMDWTRCNLPPCPTSWLCSCLLIFPSFLKCLRLWPTS